MQTKLSNICANVVTLVRMKMKLCHICENFVRQSHECLMTVVSRLWCDSREIYMEN